MNTIEKFIPKDGEKEIRGEKFKIPILRVKHIPIVNKLESPQTRSEGMKELVKLVLEANFGEVSDEDVDKVDLGLVKDLVDAVLEINGLKE